MMPPYLDFNIKSIKIPILNRFTYAHQYKLTIHFNKFPMAMMKGTERLFRGKRIMRYNICDTAVAPPFSASFDILIKLYSITVGDVIH